LFNQPSFLDLIEGLLEHVFTQRPAKIIKAL